MGERRTVDPSYEARAEAGAVGRRALGGVGRCLVQLFATANLRSERVGSSSWAVEPRDASRQGAKDAEEERLPHIASPLVVREVGKSTVSAE
jgi:hypothetical protein